MRRNTPFRIFALLLISLLATLHTGVANAGKDHCRTVELSGAAGPASADNVELQVTDYLGNVLDRSCQLTVQQNECADDLAKRVVANWGNGSAGGSQAGSCLDQALTTTCGKNLDLVPVEGGTDAYHIFCKHRYRAGKVVGGNAALEQLAMLGQCPQAPAVDQPAGFGEFKKLPKIEVCCYELPSDFVLNTFNYADSMSCAGSKLGKTLTTPQRVEVSVFDRIDRPNVGGDGIFFDPRDENDDPIVPVGDTSRQIALDPIGFHQTVAPKGATCRTGVAKALASLDALALGLVVKCHVTQPGVDCNQLSQADPNGLIDEAALNVRDTVGTSCEGPGPGLPRISPAVYGLRSCPAPCDSIPLGTCSSGLVGDPCTSDRNCDGLDVGEGRCGSWDDAADCVACLQKQGIGGAVQSVFNVSPFPGGVPLDAQRCLTTVGKSLLLLSGTFSKDMLSCQSKADTAKTAVAGAFCRSTDSKGTRAAAVSKVRAALTKDCTDTDLAGLPVCSGQTTVTGLGDCVIAAAKTITLTLSGAAFPESATVCGNGKLERDEQCDGGDDEACDGLCQADCKCPTPVCGNNVTEATEQCDGTSQLACPGACGSSNCMCGPPPPVIFQSLVTCDPGVVDRYRFKVSAGQNIDLSADTTDSPTAADLCFGPGSTCNDGAAINGDDEVPCTFESPLAHGCPHANFVASADTVCTLEVTTCSPDCTNDAQANYGLKILRNGAPTPVQMLVDNEPEP